MKTVLALLLLLSTGCANMTTGQRIALYCNPVAQAVDLAVLSLGLGLAFFGGVEQMDKTAKMYPIQQCVNAIQDNSRQAQLGQPPAAGASPSPAGPRSSPPED